MKRAKINEQKELGGIREEVRHLGVMIERVDDKVTLIAEQYGDIKGNLDSHTEILKSHTDMIGNLAINLEIVKTDVEFIKLEKLM